MNLTRLQKKYNVVIKQLKRISLISFKVLDITIYIVLPIAFLNKQDTGVNLKQN